jgi:membrane protein insertase Oxa1/YidC/SpoIIIJ
MDGAIDASVLASQKVLEAGDPLMSSLGNSPVDWCVRGLDALHHVTGLEWWAAIAVGTLAMRVVLFPLMIDTTRNANRFAKAKPHIDDIQAFMKEHPEKKEEAAIRFKVCMSDTRCHLP